MSLTKRAYSHHHAVSHWEELWEAASYYDRIAELAEEAEDYLILVGWQIDSRLPMKHGDDRESLIEKILRLCSAKPKLQIYFLVWDHAYFYILERQLWQGRIWDQIHPRVHFIFDNRHPFGASHHEKIFIVDGTSALCGGIDLCDERWDTPEHLYHDVRRSLDGQKENHGPYHDLAVQVNGQICLDIQDHIRDRWEALSSIPFPPSRTRPDSNEGKHDVYLSRTLTQIDAVPGKSIRREIEFLFEELISSARHQIILEGQYYWSCKLNDLLLAKIHERQGTDFRLTIILADLRDVKSPIRRMIRHELELLEKLQNAAVFAGVKLVIGTPYVHQAGRAARPVYIHSKLLIVDDRYLSIGSANFATRALRLDTEVNLTLEARGSVERSHIRKVARQVEKHWNLGSSGSESHPVQLRSFHAQLQQFRQRRSPQATLWRACFDPELPWSFWAKRYLFRFIRKQPLLSAAIPIVLAIGAVGIVTPPAGWPWIYGVMLAAVCIFPVPYLPLLLLATLHLGPERGASIAAYTVWTASLVGYLFGRLFPNWAKRFYRKSTPPLLHQLLGKRSFEGLLQAVAHPRISFHAKFGGLGYHFTPLPWFALLCGLVLPAALSLTARGFGYLSPELLQRLVQNYPSFWVLLALMMGFRGISFKEIKWKDTA